MQPVLQDAHLVATRLRAPGGADTLADAYKTLKTMKKELWVAALLGMLAGAPPARAIEALSLAPGEKIVLDGRLDEPAWDRAQLLDRFWEVFPQAEVEARVRTEARYAYDHHALYVAVRSWDPDPAQLRAPFARRDKVLADQDMIVLFIDPVGNRKFAHFFRVNPRGAVGDGLYNEDSGDEDFSPDFEFEVATGRFEGGWTAEFRIRRQGAFLLGAGQPAAASPRRGRVPHRQRRDPDAAVRTYQAEIFAKGSWTFEVL